MGEIILEGVLFVACIAAMAALFVWLLTRYTALGVRLQQTRNRLAIEKAVSLMCPVHGAHEEHEMVRLPSGAQICPDCYKEAMSEYPV